MSKNNERTQKWARGSIFRREQRAGQVKIYQYNTVVTGTRYAIGFTELEHTLVFSSAGIKPVLQRGSIWTAFPHTSILKCLVP